MKKTFLVILTAFAPLAWRCLVPKPEQTVSPKELVARTKNIYVAKAEKIENGVATLKVLETIKGQPVKSLEIKAIAIAKPADFHRHSLKSFWNAHSGTAQIEPDCSIVAKIAPDTKYLVFADPPYHKKSFEPILNRKDLWLKTVRSIVLH